MTVITIQRCERCDWSPIPVDAIAEFEHVIAIQIALFGPVSSETFRCMRRSVSLDLEEAARTSGVDLDTVIAVEHGKQQVPLSAWMTMARFVRDRAAAEGGGPGLRRATRSQGAHGEHEARFPRAEGERHASVA